MPETSREIKYHYQHHLVYLPRPQAQRSALPPRSVAQPQARHPCCHRRLYPCESEGGSRSLECRNQRWRARLLIEWIAPQTPPLVIPCGQTQVNVCHRMYLDTNNNLHKRTPDDLTESALVRKAVEDGTSTISESGSKRIPPRICWPEDISDLGCRHRRHHHLHFLTKSSEKVWSPTKIM